MSSKKDFGRKGEDIAVQYFIKRGYALWKKNVHIRRNEFDLLMIKGDTLLCVEVKIRSSLTSGYPAEALSHQKIEAMYRYGLWLTTKHRNLKHVQVDFLGILYNAAKHSMTITHYPHVHV